MSRPRLAWLLILSTLIGSPGCARPAGERRFEEGVRAYRAGSFEAAAAAFAAATETLDPGVNKARALHNHGNALAQLDRNAEALDAYRASLRLGDRETTRANYEIVRARLLTPPDGQSSGRDMQDERLFRTARALAVPSRARPAPDGQAPDW